MFQSMTKRVLVQIHISIVSRNFIYHVCWKGFRNRTALNDRVKRIQQLEIKIYFE